MGGGRSVYERWVKGGELERGRRGLREGGGGGQWVEGSAFKEREWEEWRYSDVKGS